MATGDTISNDEADRGGKGDFLARLSIPITHHVLSIFPRICSVTCFPVANNLELKCRVSSVVTKRFLISNRTNETKGIGFDLNA